MPDKIGRDAFLYLPPKKGVEEDFAQCGPCRMFVPEVEGREGGRCVIHGSEVEVDEDDSCGFMVPWPSPDGAPNPEIIEDHAEELAKGIPGSVSPEYSGLVSRRVQCHRCRFEENGATKCGLYAKLNKEFPDIFDLDEKITPNSCCNGQEPNDDDESDDDDSGIAKALEKPGASAGKKVVRVNL